MGPICSTSASGEGLEARGHVVDTLLIDNREIDQIGKPRAAVRAVWNQDAVRRLRTAIEQCKPDVVHVHTPFPLMSPAVFVAAHRAGLPVVSTVQAWRYNCIKATMLRDGRVCEDCVGRVVKYPGVVHRCYHDSVAGSLALTASLATHRGLGTFRNCVDRWLALTPFMRERLIAEGIAPEKIVVKPNTAPDPGLGDTERDGSVLFVGRFVPEKGIDTLLGAWAAFEGDRRLVIAGDGPLRPTVEAAAAADPRIDYRGWLDSAGVTALLASAEVLVLPSEWYEGSAGVARRGVLHVDARHLERRGQLHRLRRARSQRDALPIR